MDEIEIVDDPTSIRALMEISIVAHLSDLLFARSLPEGLTTAQFGVLNRLARLGLEESLGELAAAFRVAPPTMTSTVQQLVRKGLVELTASQGDRRKKYVVLTDAGRATREAGVGLQLELLARHERLFNQGDWQEIYPALNRLRIDLEKATSVFTE